MRRDDDGRLSRGAIRPALRVRLAAARAYLTGLGEMRNAHAGLEARLATMSQALADLEAGHSSTIQALAGLQAKIQAIADREAEIQALTDRAARQDASIQTLNERVDEGGRRDGGIEDGLNRLDRRGSKQEIAVASLAAELTLLRKDVEALKPPVPANRIAKRQSVG